MRTHNKKITKGPRKGTEVPLTYHDDSMRAALEAGHFKDEGAVMRAAYGNRGVAIDRLFRDAVEKDPNVTVAALSEIGNKYRMGSDRVPGSGGQKAKVEAAKKLEGVNLPDAVVATWTTEQQDAAVKMGMVSADQIARIRGTAGNGGATSAPAQTASAPAATATAQGTGRKAGTK